MKVRIGVCGAGGRVGRAIIEACGEDPDCVITSALGHASVGVDAGILAGVGDLGVVVIESVSAVVEAADVCIDFTHPSVITTLLEASIQHSKPLVIGTTGFSAGQRDLISEAAGSVPIVHAPNMSVGVNVCFSLLEHAARVLGDDADIEIIEAHHRNKVDAPSGTAVKMGEVIAKTLGRDLAKCAVYGREGETGVRDRKIIGFESIRGGDIVGEHTVLFAGAGERLEITHRSSSRMNFAKGALRAAKWVRDQQIGLYDMRDVLGLNPS